MSNPHVGTIWAQARQNGRSEPLEQQTFRAASHRAQSAKARSKSIRVCCHADCTARSDNY